MSSSYDRPLPAIIPRPSSNVSATRPPVPMQGQPGPQDQMMTLLALLASGLGGGQPQPPMSGGTPQPGAAPMPGAPAPGGPPLLPPGMRL